MFSTGICRWLFLLISLTAWMTLANSKELRVVCYYTNWSVYRPGTAKFSPQNINPYLCTHLIYAFGGFTKENTLKPFDKYQDIEKGGYAKFTGLKTYNKNLKTMLAIGGWNEGSSRFSPMVASADRRKELVKNAVKFLRQNHFDGLDLDWEYPNFRDGGKPRDKENYAQLVKELREEFERESEKTGRSRLLLTMAVPAGIEYINKGYDVPKLMKYLDWMNMLSYDFHSAFEPAVNHHAPLFSLEEENEYNYDTELNIDYTIKHYMKMGADPAKLVLGIPTYGRSYTLFNPDANEIGAPADGPGEMGEATRENGYLAYYEICEYVKENDWEVVQPNPNAMGPYAYKDNQWVGYDDEDIVRKKAEYVAKNGLGGIMFWAIDNDDFRGSCHGKPYPLIEAGKEALLDAYGITEDNLVAPPSKTIKSKPKTRTRTSAKSTSSVEKQDVISTTSSSSGRRRRIKSKSRNEERSTEKPKRRNESRKTTESTSHSSLKIVTPSYTTPAPPSTPDVGGAFKCEDEGFFPHPKDCKKYYWCLSGAGDTGIIAHQFTCPAGLYFNKAADSCDYTQNVLCNKKLQKVAAVPATSTKETPEPTEATSKATPSSFFSTTRAPPKITAATSRTTYKQTTTTENVEEEYEYYDDDDVEEDTKSEEDPKVIKELVDLIRKAGGIEKLEKYLNVDKDSTTPSAISKSLYEKVLSKTSKSTLSALKKTSTNRNSRGPQNYGLTESEESSSVQKNFERSRPQYKTISRQRSSYEKPNEDENNGDDENADTIEETKNSSNKKSSLEYTNIRRGTTSTTSKPETNRNKLLGEESVDEDEADEDENVAEEEKNHNTPQYVNIRRQRPSATEGPSTSRYVELRRRPTTQSSFDTEVEDENNSKYTRRSSTTEPSETEEGKTTLKYKTLRRGTTQRTTTEEASLKYENAARQTTTVKTSTEGSSTSRYQIIRRGSTLPSVDEENDVTAKYQTLQRKTPTVPATESYPDDTTPLSTVSDGNIILSDLEDTVSNTTPTESQQSVFTTTIAQSTTKNAEEATTEDKILTVLSSTVSDVIKEKKKPFLLLQPRPFSKTTRVTPSPTKISETTTETVKVSETNFKSGLRPNSAEPQTSQNVDNSSIRPRNRGLSRFNSNSRIKSKTSSEKENDDSDIPKQQRLRKRLLATTDRSVNFNEDQTRSYRPSELADLSSLTAVDFDNIKGLNLRPNSQRRRRPIATTTTTTTTEKAPERVPTTNTLTRKVINRTLFGKTAKANIKNDGDQLNESSNLSSTTKRRFRFSTTERSTTPIKDEKLSTTTVNINENASLRTVTSPRTRKIIRRFRPRTSTVKIESTTESRVSSTKTTLDNLIDQKPSRFPFNLAQNNKEADDGVEEVNEEEENIKLSESNIRENSDVNSFDDSKQRKKFVKLVRPKFESLHQKTNVVEKEKESLKDNNESNVNQNYETVSATTPLPLPLRRRKIVRKFSTTEPTSVDIQNDSENGRKRKVIRRLRPSTPYNTLETKENEKETNKYGIKINKLFLKGRSTSTTEATTTEQKVVPKILFRPSESQRNRNGDVTFDDEDNTNPKEKGIIEHSENNSTTDENSFDEHLTTPSYNSEYDSYSNYDVHDHPEMFSSTIHYEPYSSSPYFDENEDDDHTFYSFDDHDFTTSYSGEDDESDDEPEYSIMGYTSTNRSHHFESNTNFANEDEDDEAQKTLSASVINTSKNIRNESTLFTPKLNQEENEGNGDPTDKSQNDDTVKNQPKSETTTRKNPLLRSQKERPSFIRPKLTTSTTPSINNVSRPKYRNFNRSTTTIATTTTTSTTTTTTLKPEIEATEEMYQHTTPIPTTILPETETQTHTSKYIDNEILTTTEVEEDNDVESNATTERKTITINNEIDEITDVPVAKTTVENIEDTSADTTIEFFDKTTDGDMLVTLSTEEIFTEDNRTEVNPTEATSRETSLSETSSEHDVSSTTTSTTEYHPRSTLRSIQNRPKFGIQRKSEFSTTSTTRPSTRNFRNKFSNKRLQKTTLEATNLYNVETPKVIPVDKLLYKYSTTERLELNSPKDTEEDSDYEEEEGIEEIEGNNKNDIPIKSSEKPLFRPKSTNKRIQNTPFSTRKTNRPQFGKPKQRTLNKPKTFVRITETPKISEDLSELTKKLVKNRNNNLFSQRKTISPTTAPSTTPLDSSTTISTDIDKLNEVTADISESITKPSTKEMETTEYLTTLHHIFAEINETTNDAETITESLSSVTASSGKVERLIEVNRIVEVYTKEAKVKNHTGVVEEQTKVQVIPTLDKIGEVNRVTVIKVVDENGKNSTILEEHNTEDNEVKPDKNNNKTSIEEVNDIPSTSQEIARVEEVPHPGLITLNVTNIKFNFNLNNEESNREDRKFDIYGGSKVADNSLSVHGKAEIIDGKSQIDVVTPRPIYYTEASTIALQGLFTTEPPKSNLNPSFTSNDELLETEHSKFVNVRILDQDEHIKIDRGIRGETKKISVRLLPQDEDEDYTLRARVVEITPKPSFGTIKIVPIKVEMARKVRSVPEITQRSFSAKNER